MDVSRLRTLHDSLDALLFEARQLRQRIEVIIATHRFATRMLLSGAHKRRRIDDLSRANRVF